MTVIGTRVPRKEGPEKVRGRATYTDDMTLPGMIHGATVRSPIARGKITGIHFADGIPWDEFTIVTAADIPGKNVVTLILDDQPFLAADTVNHAEEAVVLLAHPDPHLLARARQNVRIEIEPLPPVLSLADSLAQKEIVWGADNIFKHIRIDKGNVDAVWDEAEIIIEGEYETGAQEQLYIEPNGVIAVADASAGVTVWGSMQCPYYVHKALMPLFGLPAEKVRVVQMATGGGFGGKEEFPSMIAGHAALLAWKSGRPVKLIYDRAEDMVATTKRHPSRTRIKTALGADGTFKAIAIDFVLDGGAYATLSAVVLSRGAIHAAGPYFCENTRVDARAVATNSPPHGAFRGFGAPQSIFAFERHLDVIAHNIGLSPVELRRRNLIRQGQTTSTGQTISEAIDMPAMLDFALQKADYATKAREFAAHNATPNATTKKGIGIASFFHGSGFTGSGEKFLASVVHAEARPDGRVAVLAASTEIGQGTNTIFSQIAADALKIPYEWIIVEQPDTAKVPNSGPTVASRTAMIVGKLVEEAAQHIAHTLIHAGALHADYTPADFAAACAKYLAEIGPLKTAAEYRQPPHVEWDDATYRGAAYGAYGWAVYVASVTVDLVTYETRVDDFVAVQDIGTVLHPELAAGQIEGGVAQAIGWAIYEDVKWRDGRMINGQMTNYIMPTAVDLPPIRTFFHAVPYAFGPAGAKGVGELPMDGPAPAIFNAVHHATGISATHVPLMPERLFAAIHRPSAPNAPRIEGN